MNLNQSQLSALANLPAIREALAAADAEALQVRQALVDELAGVLEEAHPEIVRHSATADAAMKRVGELKEEIRAQQQIEGVARPAVFRLSSGCNSSLNGRPQQSGMTWHARLTRAWRTFTCGHPKHTVVFALLATRRASSALRRS